MDLELREIYTSHISTPTAPIFSSIYWYGRYTFSTTTSAMYDVVGLFLNKILFLPILWLLNGLLTWICCVHVLLPTIFTLNITNSSEFNCLPKGARFTSQNDRDVITYVGHTWGNTHIIICRLHKKKYVILVKIIIVPTCKTNNSTTTC